MSAPSLYRRHRPRTFADVVGQEHVVRTLRNALEQGKVHHAYLFVGSRGTGKTSMAKILAASLNCAGPAGEARGRGPTITPCGVCESCRSIADANSLDVIEMDAASNNSVDDIRALREQVAFAPVSGRHKVYILDEAHMLSTAAWNAFLKTLEEPPPNTIFVLATTEAAKVLPTVVDRCHRFDFARPTPVQIREVLRRVSEAEAIELPDEAAALVARSATGSFRDALGTLEQLLAYAGQRIVLEDVLAVLGVADADLLFGAVDAVAGGDARGALQAAARLSDSGRDVGRFFGDLEAHLRALLVVQTLGGSAVPAELAISADRDARLLEQAARVSGTEVVRLLDLIAAGLRAMKDGADPRTQLELALIKGAAPQLDPSTKALLSRLERLEARAGADGSAGGSAPAGATGGAVGRSAPVGATAGAGSTGGTSSTAPGPGPVRDASPTGPAAAPAASAPSSPAHAPAASATVGPVTAAARAALAAGAVPETSHGETRVAVSAQVDGAPAIVATTTLPPDDAPAGAHPTIAVAVADPADPGHAVATELDLAAFAELWPAVLEHVQGTLLSHLLAEARPVSLAEGELTLAFAETAGFSKRKAEDRANQRVIADAIRAVTGSSLRLAYELRTEAEGAADVPSAVSEEELVARFLTEFDAEELPPEPAAKTTEES